MGGVEEYRQLAVVSRVPCRAVRGMCPGKEIETETERRDAVMCFSHRGRVYLSLHARLSERGVRVDSSSMMRFDGFSLRRAR